MSHHRILARSVVKYSVLVVVAAVLCLGAAGVSRAEAPKETKQQRDQRMAWWRKARFGMFIHWGLYAVPAGQWKGKPVGGIGEWINNNAQIPVEEYEPLAKQFNPVKFDAKEWVRIAKDAGMKYIVITTKHHEGFAMFDSKLTDYTITKATPFKRDPLKELADECHRQGIVICWYHSILDWHHPDYLPRRAWDKRPTAAASYDRYIEYMKGQLRELLTNYGQIGVIWFDGGWEHPSKEHHADEVVQLIRSLQPKIIINNRIQIPLDFDTPEQFVPATGITGRDWETCMTLNDTWGYKSDDDNWKSSEDLIRKLVDIASKGGNFLLNVGPTAEGVIPAPSVERLAAVGKWMKVNGEAIYGTTASPFRRLGWGCATKKPGKIYLHVFRWPEGPLDVPGLENEVQGAYLLADASRTPLEVGRTDRGVSVKVPARAPDPVASVVVLQIVGAPKVVVPPLTQAADGTILLPAVEAKVHGQTAKYESNDGKDSIGFWTKQDEWVSWDFVVTKPGEFEVETAYACQPGYEGSEYVIAVGDQQVSSTVQATGSWNEYSGGKVGTLKIANAGRVTLSVKVNAMPRGAVMNLKSVTLRPKK